MIRRANARTTQPVEAARRIVPEGRRPLWLNIPRRPAMRGRKLGPLAWGVGLQQQRFDCGDKKTATAATVATAATAATAARYLTNPNRDLKTPPASTVPSPVLHRPAGTSQSRQQQQAQQLEKQATEPATEAIVAAIAATAATYRDDVAATAPG